MVPNSDPNCFFFLDSFSLHFRFIDSEVVFVDRSTKIDSGQTLCLKQMDFLVIYGTWKVGIGLAQR